MKQPRAAHDFTREVHLGAKIDRNMHHHEIIGVETKSGAASAGIGDTPGFAKACENNIIDMTETIRIPPAQDITMPEAKTRGVRKVGCRR